MKRHLQNIIWKEGRYFVAQCLNVDISSFGNTRESALTNLKEALTLYFENNDTSDLATVKEAELVGAIL